MLQKKKKEEREEEGVGGDRGGDSLAQRHIPVISALGGQGNSTIQMYGGLRQVGEASPDYSVLWWGP